MTSLMASLMTSLVTSLVTSLTASLMISLMPSLMTSLMTSPMHPMNTPLIPYSSPSMTSPIRYAPNTARLAGRLEDELLHRGYALARDDLDELRRLAAAEASADATLHLKARAQVERTRAFNSGQSSGLMGQRSRQAREEVEPVSEPISGHSSGLTDGRRSRTPRRAARTSAVSSARFELTPPPQTRTTTTVAAAANAPTGATGELR